MSVYLVTRSHYEGPAVKSVRRFPEASVLEWFRARWESEDEQNRAVFESFLFFDDGEEPPAVPETPEQLAAVLRDRSSVQHDILFSPEYPHVLQALDDDDELQFAHYLFDDTYLAGHGPAAAFLLHEDWRLPEEAAVTSDTALLQSAERLTYPVRPAGGGFGATYFVPLTYYDSANLELEGPDDYGGPFRFDGVRLPDFAGYLVQDGIGASWPPELLLLRAQAPGTLAEMLERVGRLPVVDLAGKMGDDAGHGTAADSRRTLDAALEGMNARRGREHGTKSLVQASPHLAQVSIHTDTWGRRDLFHRWVLFDDLWLAAHPDLGLALLRYATHWDVLTAV